MNTLPRIIVCKAGKIHGPIEMKRHKRYNCRQYENTSGKNKSKDIGERMGDKKVIGSESNNTNKNGSSKITEKNWKLGK